MKNEFLKLSKKINDSKTQKEVDKIIVEWEIKEQDLEKWIDQIFDNIKEIKLDKLPYMLESLYKANDKIKFLFFCMILENTFDEIPFITNLEKIEIFKEKYQMLVPTLAKIAKYSYNRVADCMYLVMLNIDPKGKLFKKDEKEMIIESINDKISQLISYIKENKKSINNDVYLTMQIFLNVSCYINDKDTIILINKAKEIELDFETKIFLIKTEIINGLEIDRNMLLEIARDNEYSYKLFKMLQEIDREDIFPKEVLM